MGQEQRAIRILRNMYYINNLMKCIRGVATFPVSLIFNIIQTATFSHLLPHQVQSIKLHLSVESDSKSSIKYILCNCNRNLLEVCDTCINGIFEYFSDLKKDLKALSQRLS